MRGLGTQIAGLLLLVGTAQADGRAMFPPSAAVPGWQLTGEPEQFVAEDLWKHINGADQQYLKFGCENLTVGYYGLQDTESEIALEIYQMPNEVGSFGIYALERPPEGPCLDIGAQGYQSGGELNFFGGRYYIKLRAYPDGEAEREAANRLARWIAEEHLAGSAFPELLSRFPSEDLVESSPGLVPKAVLGLKGLKNAYTATYRAEDRELVLFFGRESDADTAEASAAAVSASLEKRGRAPLTPTRVGAANGYRTELKYHGPVLLLRRGMDVVVAKGDIDSEWGIGVLAQLLENLSH